MFYQRLYTSKYLATVSAAAVSAATISALAANSSANTSANSSSPTATVNPFIGRFAMCDNIDNGRPVEEGLTTKKVRWRGEREEEGYGGLRYTGSERCIKGLQRTYIRPSKCFAMQSPRVISSPFTSKVQCKPIHKDHIAATTNRMETIKVITRQLKHHYHTRLAHINTPLPPSLPLPSTPPDVFLSRPRREPSIPYGSQRPLDPPSLPNPR